MSGMKIVLIIGVVITLLLLAASAATVLGKNAFAREGEKVLAQFMAGAKEDLQTDRADVTPITEGDLQHLPTPVQHWLINAGVLGKPPIRTAYIEQQAMARLNKDKDQWKPLRAFQHNTLEEPGFFWQAHFQMAPFFHMAGRDLYHKGQGTMKIKLQSLFTVVDAKGDEMNQGAMVRCLAEMVWMPTMALEDYLRWEAVDDHSAKATMTYEGMTVSGIFTFDEKGYPVQFIADRYGDFSGTFVMHPWEATMSAYLEMDGYQVPNRAEITWKLPEGDYTWYQLEVTQVSYGS